MNLVTALFSIARDITTGDLDEINKLHEKAEEQVRSYHTESKSPFARMYAKLHKGWIFQLALIFLIPFISTYFLSLKNKIMNNEIGGSSPGTEDYDDFDDEDERQYYEELKNKYENDF